MRQSLVLALAAALLVACGPPRAPRPVRSATAPDKAPPKPVDAPYDLASDDDLDALAEKYSLLASDDETRTAERKRLADAFAERIQRGLQAGDRTQAVSALESLLALWRPAELARPGVLADHVDVLARVRDRFARRGDENTAALALMAVAIADPTRREAALGEVDIILQFVEELAAVESDRSVPGDAALGVLEHVVDHLPAPLAVDALVARYLARHADGHDVINTSWRVSRALARGGRLAEAPKALADVSSVGDDHLLRQLLSDALNVDARPLHWLELSRYFDSHGGDRADLDAAYLTLAEGAHRFPDEGDLQLQAGRLALARGNVSAAIQWTERASQLSPDDKTVANRLARLYEQRMATLVATDRPNAARERLEEIERFFAHAAAAFPGERLERDLADAYASMGRGLVGLGRLTEARRFLEKSLAERPSIDALETVGTIALKRGRYDRAADYFDRALALPFEDQTVRFARGRIRRLLGEALAGAGDTEEARQAWGTAIEEWEQLRAMELTGRGRAELLVEAGKLLWALDSRDDAIELFESAIDQPSDSESIYADVVAFLTVRGQYEAAADAYHRALGASSVGDYFKVYMSLWLVAEGRRAGREDDPIAIDYLASRRGPLWHDQLARLAVGDADIAELTERARTRGERAELTFYDAVLNVAPEDPKAAIDQLGKVVETNMVLFFEYDMARYILDNRLLEQPARARR